MGDDPCFALFCSLFVTMPARRTSTRVAKPSAKAVAAAADDDEVKTVTRKTATKRKSKKVVEDPLSGNDSDIVIM